MYRFLLFLLIATACTNHKGSSFDPFQYDAEAYEKVKLNYKITGKGDTTLFFIHGWNLDHTYWQNQEAEFSTSYRLVLFDLAGCGSSGKNRKNWTVENFARDISSVINKEQLNNVVLVAHSMGGEIALDVAAATPGKVIGIIGIDNLKNVGMTISKKDQDGMQPYIKEFLANYPKIAEKMAREFTVSKDSAIVHRLVNSYKYADPSIAVPSLMNLYPKAAKAKDRLLTMPFTMKFIMSTNTPYDENALKKYCKNGYQIITIDSSGHFPMIERPKQFNKALHQILQTH
ncbi:alpha/beta fold hydrolase [Dyadobacter arcticus]|uniref:Pimeloyl-ACP methyl ester carboxylesterase n=1 Tax=Dyadobacter arcticus TaxID=1078754 RepID=A0ABX0UUD7_9BACT|nr:alpha/beta hydrolase [Dyadobacter arcticus]NIJ54546.1 pimeloyl-ACP methyl ester carboxylesterase [Dyadobacter arcticus]